MPTLRNHFAASLLAAAALFSTVLHVLVLSELFARLGAAGTNVRTSLADRVRERTAARNDLCCRGANVGAVAAGGQGARVLVLAVFEHLGAVRRTTITFALTIGTGFGAHVFLPVAAVVCVAGLFLCWPLSKGGTLESCQGQGGKPRNCKFTSFHKVPSLRKSGAKPIHIVAPPRELHGQSGEEP